MLQPVSRFRAHLQMYDDTNVIDVGYHASGTCAMGKADNPNAVLDTRLRVRGVRNLRVADVSSIPKVNNGHTQMVAYGIGEGAAEMIKEDAAENHFLKLTADVKSMAM